MRVEELMTRNVKSCGPDANLAEVASRMWEADCGIVPVTDEHRKAVGVLTDRDICIALATRNRPASDVTAREAMSGTVHACRPEDDVKAALQIMKARKVRRLPVTGEDGTLQGILSLNDIVLRADASGRRSGGIPAGEVVGTLAAICEHGGPKAASAAAGAPRARKAGQ